MARIFYSRDCEQSPDSNVELTHVLGRLNRGDALIVPSIDHLGHRWSAVREVLRFLEDRGVILAPRITSIRPGEPPELAFRRDLKRVQTDRAHARGAYARNTGRPRKGNPTLARRLKDSGVPFEMIVTVLGVTPRTLHRYFQP